MEAERINLLVSIPEQERLRRMDEMMKEYLSKSLFDSALGDELTDLVNYFLAFLYMGNVSFIPLLKYYIRLLKEECALYDPVTAYAYGKDARDKQLDFQTAYRAYLHDIGAAEKTAAIVEARGKCRTYIRAIIGDESDRIEHSIDRYAVLYRKIHSETDFLPEFFCKCGYDGL